MTRPRAFSVVVLALLTGCVSSAPSARLLPAAEPADVPMKSSLSVTSNSDNGPGSLREAIAKAKKGATITFRLKKRAKIVLTSGPITIVKSVSISGPGAALLSISGDGKSQIFKIAARQAVAIARVTLRKGRAAQGGAVENDGTLTLDNDVFSANEAFDAATTLRRASASFDPRPHFHNGRAAKHPAAPRFIRNAAVASGGAGGAIYTTGELVVSACTFSGNHAGGSASGSYGLGGAIAQLSGTAKISGSTFTSNLAGAGGTDSWGTGGAVYTTAGTLTLSDDTFSSNKAGGGDFGYGGAVYADQWFSGSNDTFNGNVAYGNGQQGNAFGGAIYAGTGLSVSRGQFSNNAAMGGSSRVYGYAFGGAIDSEASASLSGVSFTSNSTTGGNGGSAGGGAVYVGGGTSAWNSVTFSSNIASASGNGSYADGGAVSVFSGLTISGASSFSSNQAEVALGNALGADGGAVAVQVGPFAFTGSASNNVATTEGGAFWIDDVASMANSLLSVNRVTAVQSANDGGGGIYVGLGGTLTVTGSTLTGNATAGSVPNTGGGGIFNAGSASFANSTIDGNKSSVDGGGIENEAAGGFSLANVTVYQNVASGAGGNLKNHFADASMAIANSIFAGGSAGGSANDVSNDGSIVSGDYNIIQSAVEGHAPSGAVSHNLAADPKLAALTNNGGPTPTNADSSSSPGTAYIPFNNCLALDVFVDQRGYLRDATVNGYCDVGAFEDQSP